MDQATASRRVRAICGQGFPITGQQSSVGGESQTLRDGRRLADIRSPLLQMAVAREHGIKVTDQELCEATRDTRIHMTSVDGLVAWAGSLTPAELANKKRVLQLQREVLVLARDNARASLLCAVSGAEDSE